MSVEQNQTISEKPEEVLINLDKLWEFSLEQIRCQELLSKIDGRQSFVFTQFLENICNWNLEAKKILNRTI